MSVKLTHSKEKHELRKGAVGFWGVLAQSVALIGPSGAPLVAVPVVFLSAGLGTWASFLISTIGIIFIAQNIKIFAQESSGTGSLYGYIARSLGPNVGVLGGWALTIAYIGIAAACAPLFAYYINVLLEPFKIHLSVLALTIAFTAVAWFFAWKDIRLSAHLMLWIELAALSVGVILAAVILFKQGINFDLSQFTVKNLKFSGIGLGMVLSFMAFTGFESATSIGDEAHQPLKTIPKAIIISSLSASVYFIIWSYTLISGFRGLPVALEKSSAPVNDLAASFGVSALAVILTIACTVGTFAVVLASINAGARTLHHLAEHGIVHSSIAEIHKSNKTPHVAVTVASLITLLVPFPLIIRNVALLDIWGYIGSVATFGLLVTYLLVSIGAVAHLKKKGILKIKNIIVTVLAIGVVLIPIVGSVYPVPPYPYNILVYVFVGLLAAGYGFFVWQRYRQPHLTATIKQHLETKYESYAEERIG